MSRNDGAILDELKTVDGIAQMSGKCGDASRAEYFAHYLASSVAVLLGKNSAVASQCVVSGMAGSRLGWKELPYAALPQPLDGSGLMTELLSIAVEGHGSLDVILVSGIRAKENVMRGEETEIIGLAREQPSISRGSVLMVVMPGTHSKHIRLAKGMIVDFETVMTGELYAHLSTMPTLRDSMMPGAAFDGAAPAFIRGVREASSPGFSKSLFGIRARSLLSGASPAEGSAFLSGLLIGTELLQIPTEPSDRVLVASGGSLGALYRAAARELELSGVEFIDGEQVKKAAINGHLRILESRERVTRF